MAARQNKGHNGNGRKKSSGNHGSGPNRHTRKNVSVASLPVGKISITSGGYGFVDSSDGRFFVPPERVNGAMDGDTVRIKPKSQNWKRQAQRASNDPTRTRQAPLASVDRVLERATVTIVGMFVTFDGIGYVIPQDKRMDYLIRASVRRGADLESPTVTDGDIVLLTIETYPSRHESPSGVIDKVIGRDGDPNIMEDIIASKHGLDTKFSDGCIDESKELALDIEAALEEPDRIDIRDRFILTIDPADARDFDDALSLDFVDGTTRLGVHIADVSHYVKWGDPIDLDARHRTTSVYFPDRVIPMLPEKLSNGLCSLNPDEDRLAFTVDLYLDDTCDVIRSEMYPSVIRSRCRLDYTSVQKMFDGEGEYPSIEAKQTLMQLRKVSNRLMHKRFGRGALDFETTEIKVVVDENGTPIELVQRQRNEATDLVEESMIAANEAVAHYMLDRDAPMVYRIHDEPKTSSLEEIVPILRELGYSKEGVPTTNHKIAEILSQAKGKPEGILVNTLLLRAMKQAVYRDEYTTHFGLASDGYTHFTSPIRRYPDLMVHRLLRYQLFAAAKASGKFPPRPDGSEIGRSEAMKMPAPDAIKGVKDMFMYLNQMCDRCSVMEREAEKASYEALSVKICEYMEQFVGQRFSTIIVNVMAFGFFVRISDGQVGAGCEGLVPVRDISGFYEYDDEKRRLIESDSPKPKSYSLGQAVEVTLVSADTRKGQLTFGLT